MPLPGTEPIISWRFGVRGWRLERTPVATIMRDHLDLSPLSTRNKDHSTNSFDTIVLLSI